MEVAEAHAVLNRVSDALPCQRNIVNQQSLASVFFYKGLTEFQLGQREAAQQSFQRSLAIDRSRSWDTSYPPEPQQEFLLAKETVIDASYVNLGYSFAGTKVSSFCFDGASYEPDHSGIIAVAPGLHVVHYTVDDVSYSRLVELRGGDETAIVSRQGLTDAVLAGPYGNRLLAASLISLDTLCKTRGYTRAYVADGTKQVYVFENGIYDSLEHQLTSDGSIIRPKKAGGGMSLTIFGFTYAYQSPYANVCLRGHAGLHLGWELDFGAGVSLSVFEIEPDVTAIALLPYVRIGTRYRILKNDRFQPYFGANAVIAFVQNEANATRPNLGVVGLVGLNLHLSKVLYFNYQIDFGYLGGFNMSHHAGLGLQF